jgi:hypothetical protein
MTAATMMAAYKTVPAVSVKLYGGTPEAYDTTAPDFLCMDYDQAKHALEHGHAAVVDVPTWDALRKVWEVAA